MKMSKLVKYLYHVPPPSRVRSPEKPMSVLALGLSRSGTDSLRAALMHLGYVNCYHGTSTVDEGWADSRGWYDLLIRKFHGPGQDDTKGKDTITTADFDAILGDCMAITDIPAVMFGPELLAAYPDAKVILNRRSDLKQWKDSFRATTLSAEQSWFIWLVSFFNAELFWMERIFILCINALFHGDYERNAEKTYQNHYDELEGILGASGRDYLKWEVQEGWSPLCQFLGKEEPEISFPWRNSRENHDDKIGALVGTRVKVALQRILVIFGAAFCLILALWWRPM